MWLKYREHDGESFRVWTEEQSRYGQFQILTREQLITVIKACRLMSYDCVPAPDAECDPVM
jgi:hypothetical protein